MKTSWKDMVLAVALILVILVITPMGRDLIAQTSYSVQGWLGLVTDTTNDSLQVSIVSTDSNQTVGGNQTVSGNLAVTGTSTLTGAVTTTADTTVGDDLTVNGWVTIPMTTVAAASYTISSSGKASGYLVNYTDTAAASILLPDGPADGTLIFVKDGDLNAGSNNITVAPNGGGSDTIDEGSTYAMNANGEAVTLVYDETTTDWCVVSGYAE